MVFNNYYKIPNLVTHLEQKNVKYSLKKNTVNLVKDVILNIMMMILL
jgi:hypothetical protein